MIMTEQEMDEQLDIIEDLREEAEVKAHDERIRADERRKITKMSRKVRTLMASLNKKRKAKNSYLWNGGVKTDIKMKRVMYFTKRQRKRINKMEEEQE